MHSKGHQMMTFTADCGPIVHVNATSQNSACVFVQGRQFTANCCTGMADLATVVSQALAGEAPSSITYNHKNNHKPTKLFCLYVNMTLMYNNTNF